MLRQFAFGTMRGCFEIFRRAFALLLLGLLHSEKRMDVSHTTLLQSEHVRRIGHVAPVAFRLAYAVLRISI